MFTFQSENSKRCCYSFSSIFVEPFNFVECFFGIRKMYDGPSLQDTVRSFLKVVCLWPESQDKILGKLFIKCFYSEFICWNSKYNFCLKNDIIGSPQKGEWWTNDNSFKGESLFSLVRTFRKDESDLETFNFVAETLGVDFSKSNVDLSQPLKGYTFIPSNLDYRVYFSRYYVDYLLDGPPNNEFIFRDINGLPAFKLLEWSLCSEPIQLFFSLYENNDTRERLVEYLSPPPEYMIFNRDWIENDKNKEVHIHDQIARANTSNLEQARYNSSNIVQTIATWSGDLSFSSELDWDFLQGREVLYIFDKFNKNSIVIGDQLIRKFSRIGMTLKLHDVSKWAHSS